MIYRVTDLPFPSADYPNLNGKQNYIRLKFVSDSYVYNGFHCCRTLNKVDEVTDAAKDAIKSMGFSQDYSRDTKCLIAFQITCGECGAGCDGCGAQCPDACPNHSCG